MAHLIEQGLKILPASVKGTDYIIARTLFDAAKGNDVDTRSVVLAVRDIMPAIMEQSIHNARATIDLVVENISAQPHLLREILEEANIALKAVSREHPGEDYALNSIKKMLTIANDDPRLRRQIIRMGQEVALAGMEKKNYGNERLFNTLYSAGKDDPLLLPGLIQTAWQTFLPQHNGGHRSDVIQDLIDIAQQNPDARAAHMDSARIAIMSIFRQDSWYSWHIGGPLKILRDALGLKDDRRVLTDNFAMIKLGRGKSEREIWFIPKGGDTVVLHGSSVVSINDIAKKDFAKAGVLAQIGRAASAVFFEEMTVSEGRTRIRRETGLRFETLR